MFDNNSDRSVLSVGRYIDEENQTTAREILQALIDSRAAGTVIGITSTLFGRSMFLTGVIDIILGDPSMVILQAYDTNGYILPETKIPLPTITAVRSFASKFVNPFVSKLNEDPNPLL